MVVGKQEPNAAATTTLSGMFADRAAAAISASVLIESSVPTP